MLACGANASAVVYVVCCVERDYKCDSSGDSINRVGWTALFTHLQTLTIKLAYFKLVSNIRNFRSDRCFLHSHVHKGSKNVIPLGVSLTTFARQSTLLIDTPTFTIGTRWVW